MKSVELVVALLAVAGVLRVLAGRIGVPYPVLFVLGGLALALIPGLPRPDVDPDTLFLVFIPPLLYWAALNTSLRDFRAQFWPIARFGTLVVLITIAAVAVVAHVLSAEISWPAAFLLGAIVSPPDPVAAIAVLRPLGAPRTIVTILGGEGLVNDATALVAYRIAVTAVVTGQFSLGSAFVQLLLTGAGGVAVGLAVGWLIGQIRGRIRPFPIVENTFSLLTPFIAYIPADALGLSGILAVVAVGLYLGRLGPRILSAPTRVQAEGMWSLVEFVLESIFILIGLDLPCLHGALQRYSLSFLIGLGAAVALTCIVTRLVYTAVAATILRANRRRKHQRIWPGWSQAAFIGWTGMRGGDSLVLALALPAATARGAAFPGRDLIIFTTFSVILATLVVQGFTLVPLLRFLGLRASDTPAVEEAHARRVAAEAGLARLDQLPAAHGPGRAMAEHLREMYRRKLRRWAVRDRARHGAGDADHRGLDRAVEGAPADGGEFEAASYRTMRGAMVDAERSAIIGLRDAGTIGDDVLRRLQRELDLEEMLIDSGNDDAPESPFDPDPPAG